METSLPPINCEVELDLSWAKDCTISEILNVTDVPASPAADLPIEHVAEGSASWATFQINSAKLNVPIVTLSTNDNIKFLENIKQGFQRTVSLNKYRSEITI